MMKKLLGIVVLGLLWCGIAFSKNYHSQIFGIKILDDVNNYIEECDIGGTYLVTENCIDLHSERDLVEIYYSIPKYEKTFRDCGSGFVVLW